jgi:CTP:phosphocholine cytidylyltransferase-like protein
MRHFVKKNYQEKNITVLKNQDYDKFNDVQSLNVAADYLDQACLIMSGYLIPDPKLLENIPEQNSQVFLSKKENNVGCIVRDKKVSNISFGLPNYLQDIYYINREDILKIKPLVRMKSNQNCFFFEILNTIIDQNSTIYTNTEKPK